jgi:hypothetical protein
MTPDNVTTVGRFRLGNFPEPPSERVGDGLVERRQPRTASASDCGSAHLCFLPPTLPPLPPNNLAPRCRRRAAEQSQDGGRHGGTLDRTIGVIDRLVA